jgi:hypothetical protein
MMSPRQQAGGIRNDISSSAVAVVRLAITTLAVHQQRAAVARQLLNRSAAALSAR